MDMRREQMLCRLYMLYKTNLQNLKKQELSAINVKVLQVALFQYSNHLNNSNYLDNLDNKLEYGGSLSWKM